MRRGAVPAAHPVVVPGRIAELDRVFVGEDRKGLQEHFEPFEIKGPVRWELIQHRSLAATELSSVLKEPDQR
jgi:hypothetical protein